MDISYIFEVILVLIFGSLGVLGNILLIKLFVKTETKVNFHTHPHYSIIFFTKIEKWLKIWNSMGGMTND